MLPAGEELLLPNLLRPIAQEEQSSFRMNSFSGILRIPLTGTTGLPEGNLNKKSASPNLSASGIEEKAIYSPVLPEVNLILFYFFDEIRPARNR